MTAGRISARFLDGARGRILVVARLPAASDRGRAALVVPPFAEEMNKSRRMITELAERLAALGVATVVPDLFGTGDSEGEFCDGDWDVWKQDVSRAAVWSANEGWPVFAVLATRLGCALAAETSRDLLDRVERTVFWAPALDGARFLTQFLRLRVAASMMADGRGETVGGLRERLRHGETLEVAGYALSPSLADRIDGLRLVERLGPHVGELHWMEVLRTADLPMPDASVAAIMAAEPGVGAIRRHIVAGEPFWSATEIVLNADLVDRTVAALTGES